MKRLTSAIAVLGSIGFCNLAAAQDAATSARPAAEPDEGQSGIAEIIVTAQKRSESINKVGMSINAVSGESLKDLGVTATEDLVKVVPALTFAPSAYGVPVYTLRGVGFFDAAIGTTSPVSIYLDEAPLPYPVMAKGAVLDLERVEVLKGPQGTLFGQNSTGGAINYIAAKPTKDLRAGVDLTFGRFGQIIAGGFVSGPISDTLGVRVAGQTDHTGPWQYSYTRPNDRLGERNFTSGRLLADWTPTDSLKISLNLNGFRDRSENPSAAFFAIFTPTPKPALAVYPIAPLDPSASDWNPGVNFYRHGDFGSATGRVDLDLTSAVKLTSITSYQDYRHDSVMDNDGTSLTSPTTREHGRIETFSQELRLAIDLGTRANFIVGGNYSKYKFKDLIYTDWTQSAFPIATTLIDVKQDVETRAVFASGNWNLTDQLRLEGGVRYTRQSRDFAGCLRDTGDGTGAAFIVATVSQRLGRTVTVSPGSCLTLDRTGNPNLIVTPLREENVSWRVGLNYQMAPSTLVYANVSKGFNSGNFGTGGATTFTATLPAKQEELMAYEVGFKSGLFGRTLQLNGSVFYYDYTDKQIKGRVPDPLFGVARALLNIPKSSIKGAELQLNWAPTTSFRTNVGISYIDSRVKGNFTNVTILGTTVNFDGEHFTYTPVWQGTFDAEYAMPIRSNLEGFIGTSWRYQSSSTANYGRIATQNIDAYALGDIRAGVRTNDERIGITAFVRNLGCRLINAEP